MKKLAALAVAAAAVVGLLGSTSVAASGDTVAAPCCKTIP